MAVSEGFLEYVMERLERLGTVTARKMFGGVGLYFEGTFFALIDDDVLYFKVDEQNELEYRRAGMEPFRPFGADSYSMKYYALPENVLDDDGELHSWAQGAIAAAKRKGRRRGSTGGDRKSTGKAVRQPTALTTRKKEPNEKPRKPKGRPEGKPQSKQRGKPTGGRRKSSGGKHRTGAAE